jgi:hypothetical protein
MERIRILSVEFLKQAGLPPARSSCIAVNEAVIIDVSRETSYPELESDIVSATVIATYPDFATFRPFR